MPATQDHTIAGHGYGNAYIDSLVWGASGWNEASGPITYYFANNSDATAGENPGSATYQNWSANDQAGFVAALNAYSSVCGLTFAAATSIQTANLVEWRVDDDYFGNDGTIGRHEVPTGGDSHFGNANQVWGYFNYQSTGYLDEPQRGGGGMFVFMHELGHGMGLAHPHDGGGESDGTKFPGVTSSGDTGDNSQNQAPFTIMSYNSGYDLAPPIPNDGSYGFMGSLGAFDIAALQELYGANMSTATGNDTYVMPTANQLGTFWTCIWDAGGTDTISNSGSSLGSLIDLRDAPLTGTNAGGFVSANVGVTGGFTIAHGVVIENAIGGSGADAIVGNLIGNTLTGNNGNDTIVGNAGNDSVLGGVGNDLLYGDAMKGLPTGVGMGSGMVTKAAGAGNVDMAHAIDVTNLFSLTSNANILNSTTTPHVTVSGTGDGNIDYYKLTVNAGTILTFDIDATTGGMDSYIVLVDSSGRQIASADDSSTSTGAGGSTSGFDSFLTYAVATTGVYYLVVEDYDGVIQAGDTYQLQISAAGAPDTGSGNGNDTLIGDAGNDTIDGGLGADSMVGGANNDFYYVDNAGDRVVEALNGGTDVVHTTLSTYTLTANVETLYMDGTGPNVARGNDLANRVYGNGDDDRFVVDAGGNDTFYGGNGIDSFDARSSTTGIVLHLENQTLNAGAIAGDTFGSVERFSGSNTAGDNMTAGSGRAYFVGGGGNDTLTGGANNDNLFGGDGADRLVGGGARDVLWGGAGNDTMSGGTSADRDYFQFGEANFGNDRITDFQDGIDVLKFLSSVADNVSDFTITGNGTHDVLIRLNAQNSIALHNDTANITITAHDFLFY